MRIPGAGRFVRGWGCLCLVGIAGCGSQRSGAVVLVAASVQAPAILRSEAEQIGAPVRVDAPLRFENQSGEDQIITVSKTGCSCYGMATKEFVLEAGEKIRIPKGGHRELYFVTRLLEGETDQAFRVGFSIGGADSATASPDQGDLRAECSMKIVPDLVLEPASLIVDLPADGNSTERQRFGIVLKRVTRGRPENVEPPELVMEPPLLRSEAFTKAGEPVEVATGLWRLEWKSTLEVGELPAEVQANGGRYAFSVEFPDVNDPPVRRNRPRAEDSMPTVLDVVTDQGDRKVSGQLVLRQSKGVIAPREIHFGAIRSGEKRTRRIVLTAADKTPFVVEVDKPPAFFEVELDSTEPAAQQWLSVTLAAGTAGEIAERLELRTTHPEQPGVGVDLKAKVQPADGGL